jgi:outer membrane protein assembly factor BamE
MTRKALALAAAAALTFLSGCTAMEIEQGNYLTARQVDEVNTGMTPRQVRRTLGEPLLTDPFHPQRWDYVFWLKDEEGNTTRRRLTVYFNDDQRVERIQKEGGPFPEGYAPESAS